MTRPVRWPSSSARRSNRPFVWHCRTRSRQRFDEITLELAPGSVELRLRGRDPEFVVSRPPDDVPSGFHEEPHVPIDAAEAKQGAMSRINLRMPEQLRTRIEAAAASAGLSVNAWLVRAAAAAADQPGPRRHTRAATHGSQRYTGWAR